jgi:hypothetical protein
MISKAAASQYLKRLVVSQKYEAILSAPVSRVKCKKLVLCFP